MMSLTTIGKRWPISRLKHVASLRFSNVDKKTEDGELSVRLCNYTDVYKNEFIRTDMDFMAASATQEERERFALRRHDVIITKDSETPDDIAVPALVVDDLGGVVCGYHLAILRPREDRVLGPYLLRVLQADGVRQQFYTRANGVTRFGLGQQEIGDVLVPVPPVHRQRRIADFLDRKTAAIDELIRKKERLIELLQEKRQALITEAVTKGLDPAVPMKDSGVAWIGTIPSHWKFLRGRFLLRPWGGYAPEAVVEQETGLPYLKVDDLNKGDQPWTLPEAEVRVSADGFRPLPAGSILIPKRGAAIFTNKVRLSTEPCVFDSNVMGLSSTGRAQVRFLAMALWSRGLRDVADVSTIPQINNKHVYEVVFPLPPPVEQERIVAWVEDAEARILRGRSLLNQEISALREYRQALITAAVTGQLEVA